MDHQPRAAREIAIFRCKEAHESRAGRIDRGLAQEHQPPLRIQIGVKANILTHQARDFRIAAQRRYFDDHQPLLRRAAQAVLEMQIHAMIDDARQNERGDRVIVRLPVIGRIEAYCIWSRDNRAGYQFERILESVPASGIGSLYQFQHRE